MFALTILNLVLLAQVQKEEILATHETVYRVSEGKACSLSWTLARTDPNRTVAQLRTDCELPLGRVLSMSDQILDTIEKTGPEQFRALEALFVGGLSGLPEMRSRLVLLASGSGEWDSVRVAADFREPKKDPERPDDAPVIPAETLRLIYVALTRAQLVLNRHGVAWIDHYLTRKAMAA